jgi:glyoxylase-like metal-dependent hydrolase (beta-lactamase superfamily II)
VALEQLSERVFLFRDVCNVFVLVDGDAALLVDPGTGAVLDELGSIGVARADWALVTHHHRDQLLGAERLRAAGVRIAVPSREARWFERAEESWQDQAIADRYDCTNLYDRPLADVRIDRRLEDYERFRWGGLELEVLPTPGHTKGHVAYLAEVEGIAWAFTGDLIHSRGRIWTLHDLHWDYSDPDGIDAELHSVQVVRRRGLDRLAPAHGDPMLDPAAALDELDRNLREFLGVVGGSYLGDIGPKFAADPAITQVSEHLLTVEQTSANFHVLLGEDGRALLFDYGFPGWLGHVGSGECRFVEHSLYELERDYGVRTVDVAVATHFHDDHVAGFNYLRERYGTQVWAQDVVADVIESPAAYRLPATWRDPVPVDRRFAEGDELAWDRYSFVVKQLPGHTWYASGFFGEIDGVRTAVIGDELQLDASGELRGGGPVYPNRFRIDSFRRGLEAIASYEPERLLTGHDGARPTDAQALDGLRRWCDELDRTVHALAPPERAVGFALDPAFVAVRPYFSSVPAETPVALSVEVTNHEEEPARACVKLVPPDGWLASPVDATKLVGGGATETLEFSLTPPADAATGRRHLVAAEVELGGHALGRPGEAVVTLTAP